MGNRNAVACSADRFSGDAVAHWITPNERNIVPKNYITLDCESRRTRVTNGERQTFRCASLAWDRRSTKTDTWMATEWRDFDNPIALWSFVDGCVRANERMVIVSHNAGYDIRIADALRQLADLGWSLEVITLDAKASWAAWRRGKQRIVWVDSMTWLPHSLAKIGTVVGHAKRPLPDDSDSTETWLTRCRDDVAILRSAWMRVVQWLMDGGHGNWRPTGAGQCWQSFRHNHLTHRILVHDDLDARAAERRAAWTGRAEAWRHGKLIHGPYTEFDMSAAYARIAQRHNVPTRLIGETSDATMAQLGRPSPNNAFLIECTVTTDHPTVPTMHDGKIVWPIGTFATTLWDNELRLAISMGAKVDVQRQWAYRTQPALKAWADWLLSVIDAPKGRYHPVIRMLVKHWSRALIGRFGSRYSTWDVFGEAPSEELSLGWARFDEDESARRMLHVGDRVLMQSDVVEGRDAAPQVMSWIMAQCRCDLWALMHNIGIEHVVYVDTDAVIVGPGALDGIERLSGQHLVRKAHWRRIEIIGTRRIVLDGDLRAAGVSRDAERIGEHAWSAESWQGVASSLASGDPSTVMITKRTIRLKPQDSRRVHLHDGSTTPVRIG